MYGFVAFALVGSVSLDIAVCALWLEGRSHAFGTSFRVRVVDIVAATGLRLLFLALFAAMFYRERRMSMRFPLLWEAVNLMLIVAKGAAFLVGGAPFQEAWLLLGLCAASIGLELVCVAHLRSSAGTLPSQHVFLRSAVGAMATMNFTKNPSEASSYSPRDMGLLNKGSLQRGAVKGDTPGGRDMLITDEEKGEMQLDRKTSFYERKRFLSDWNVKVERLRVTWAAKVEELAEMLRTRGWGGADGGASGGGGGGAGTGGGGGGGDGEGAPLLLLARMFAQEESAIEELEVMWARDPKWTEFFLPQYTLFLLYASFVHSSRLEELLLERCELSVHVAHTIYWFLKAFCVEGAGVTPLGVKAIEQMLHEVVVRGERPAQEFSEQGWGGGAGGCMGVFDEEQACKGTRFTHTLGGVFAEAPAFVDELVQIASELGEVDKDHRTQELRRRLAEVQDRHLPSRSIYLPVGKRRHRVYRIAVEESFSFSTKERAPYLVTLEVIDCQNARQCPALTLGEERDAADTAMNEAREGWDGSLSGGKNLMTLLTPRSLGQSLMGMKAEIDRTLTTLTRGVSREFATPEAETADLENPWSAERREARDNSSSRSSGLQVASDGVARTDSHERTQGNSRPTIRPANGDASTPGATSDRESGTADTAAAEPPLKEPSPPFASKGDHKSRGNNASRGAAAPSVDITGQRHNGIKPPPPPPPRQPLSARGVRDEEREGADAAIVTVAGEAAAEVASRKGRSREEEGGAVSGRDGHDEHQQQQQQQHKALSWPVQKGREGMPTRKGIDDAAAAAAVVVLAGGAVGATNASVPDDGLRDQAEQDTRTRALLPPSFSSTDLMGMWSRPSKRADGSSACASPAVGLAAFSQTGNASRAPALATFENPSAAATDEDNKDDSQTGLEDNVAGRDGGSVTSRPSSLSSSSSSSKRRGHQRFGSQGSSRKALQDLRSVTAGDVAGAGRVPRQGSAEKDTPRSHDALLGAGRWSAADGGAAAGEAGSEAGTSRRVPMSAGSTLAADSPGASSVLSEAEGVEARLLSRERTPVSAQRSGYGTTERGTVPIAAAAAAAASATMAASGISAGDRSAPAPPSPCLSPSRSRSPSPSPSRRRRRSGGYTELRTPSSSRGSGGWGRRGPRGEFKEELGGGGSGGRAEGDGDEEDDFQDDTDEDEDAGSTPKVIFKERWRKKEMRLMRASRLGHAPGWRLMPVIVKAGDDLRQEQLASQFFALANSILKQSPLGSRAGLRPYDIVATSPDAGIIEAIPDTVSLDALKKNDPLYKTLSGFFHRHFGPPGSRGFQRARRYFVESLAANCIVTYLLQVKDRHNGNILLDARGRVIHIDFGFMLANSPGGNFKFESAPFKLTAEFVDLMDGPSSACFKGFREVCVQTFMTLRRKMPRLILLVESSSVGNAHLPCFAGRPDAVVSELRGRFKPDVHDRAAMAHVHKLIDRSMGCWRTSWYDWYQNYTVGIAM